MAILPLLPNIQPSFSLIRQTQPRVLRANFGDGYANRARDGINSQRIVMDLEWKVLLKGERDALIEFFEDRGAVEAFQWVMPDTGENNAFVCETWQESVIDFQIYNLRAKFTEVFEPITGAAITFRTQTGWTWNLPRAGFATNVLVFGVQVLQWTPVDMDLNVVNFTTELWTWSSNDFTIV